MWGLMVSHTMCRSRKELKSRKKAAPSFLQGGPDHCFLIFIDVVHTQIYIHTKAFGD